MVPVYGQAHAEGYRCRHGVAAAALAASGTLVFLPTTTSASASASTGGGAPPRPPVVTHGTLFEHEGSSAPVVLAIPVLVAALGLVVGAGPGPLLGRTLAAFLLGAFSFLGAASAGPLLRARRADHGPRRVHLAVAPRPMKRGEPVPTLVWQSAERLL